MTRTPKPTKATASHKYQPLTPRGRKRTGEALASRCTARSSRGSQCVKATHRGGYHKTSSGTLWY